jgi:hypothetical protein
MHLAVNYDKDLDKLIFDRKLLAGSGSSIYGLEFARSLHMDKKFLDTANSIRKRLAVDYDNVELLMKKKKSKYNKDLYLTKCVICSKPVEDVHHIEPQKNADKNGFIGHGGNNLGYSFREYYNPTTNELVLFFANTRIIPFGKKLKKELFNYLKGEHNTVQFNSNIVNDFASALGKYAFDSHGMKMDMAIIKKEDQLFFAAQGAEVILVNEGSNKLKSSAFGIELEVKDNNYDELIFRQNGLETTIKRIK